MLILIGVASLFVGLALGIVVGAKGASGMMRDVKRAWTSQLTDLTLKAAEESQGKVSNALKSAVGAFDDLAEKVKSQTQVKQIVMVPDSMATRAIAVLKRAEDRFMFEIKRSTQDINWSEKSRQEFGELVAETRAARTLLETYADKYDPNDASNPGTQDPMFPRQKSTKTRG